MPLDARPFRVVVLTVQVTATLTGHLDLTARPLSISTLVDTIFELMGLVRPPRLSISAELATGTGTAVRQVRSDTLSADIARALQPYVRIQILIQDPPNIGRDSTRELLSPEVFVL